MTDRTVNDPPGESELRAARIPARIGPLELLEKLGEGGMGVVYRARHVELELEMAVKFLNAGEEAERFLNEARTMARLVHPGIVKIHHVDLSGDTPYMVMDLVPGETLAAAIKKQLISPRRALHLAARICRILEYAHGQQVIHRDLKPGNIMLLPDGEKWELRVMDFGLAKHHDTSLTRSGTVLGTPCYMSPEQAEGRRDSIGPTIDVYSIGVVLYEMLCGTPPFAGESIPEILYKVVHADPLSPRLLNPAVDRYAEAICLKALEKSPARRYQGAGAMAQDLERHLAGKPIVARPIGPLSRGLRWVRRHRWSTLALCCLALLLCYLAFEAWFPAPVEIRGFPEGTLASVDLGQPALLVAGERLWLLPGYHRLVLSHPDREPFETDLHLRAARRQQVAARMLPAHGTLQVDVDGARVEVRRRSADAWRVLGTVRGRLARPLRNGHWQVRLSRPGYRAALFERRIAGGRTSHIDRPLDPQTAQVTLQGGPGEVALRLVHRESGELVRFTSRWQGALRVGWHDVRIARPNYFPRQIAFEVRAGGGAEHERESNVLRVLLARRELWRYHAGSAPRLLASAEFSGDGCPDFALATDDHVLHVVEGFFGRPLWRVKLPRRAVLLHSVPDVTGDGRPELVVGLAGGALLCYSGWQPRSREVAPLWRIETAPARSLSTVAGGGLVLCSADGTLALHDAKSGKQRAVLARVTAGRLAGHVTLDLDRDGVADHVLLLQDEAAGALQAISGKTGKPLWRRALAARGLTLPAAVDLTGDGRPNLALAGDAGGGTLFLLDGRDGALLGQTRLGGRITAPVAVAAAAGKRPPWLAVGSWDRCFSLLERGRIRWQDRGTSGWFRQPGAIGDLDGDGRPEVVYGATDHLLRVAGGDGRLWSYQAGGELRCAPRLVDLDWDGRREIVACFADGTLRAIRAVDPGAREEQAGARAVRPARLVIGAPAYLEAAQLAALYQPLVDYLSRRVGLPCVLRVLPYRQVLEQLVDGKCQMAVLSPLSYVLARDRVRGLVLLASHVAASQPSFRGVVVVRDASPYRELYDLAGQRVAFVDRDSTTGDLYPRAHLLSAGLDPRSFWKVGYAGTHSNALKQLLAGEVEAAATYAEALDDAAYHGLDTARLRVVDTSEPIPYDAYVARPELPPDVVRALRHALLRLDVATPEGRRILGRAMRIDRWLPPDDRRYDGVRRVLELLRRHGVR